MNNLKWDDLNKAEYQAVYAYYKGLIAFRKAHPALRMTSPEDVATYISNLTSLEFNVTGFRIGAGVGGAEDEIIAIFNPRSSATTVKLPEGKWNIYVDGEKAGTEILASAETEVSVAPISAMVLVKDVPQTTVEETAGENSAGILLGATAAVAAVAAAACVMVKRRKKES